MFEKSQKNIKNTKKKKHLYTINAKKKSKIKCRVFYSK
jgi:hypothetical protein